MVLGRGLIDAAGERHAMAGLLPLETSFAARRLHLGYRHIATLADTALGAAGPGFAGHAFHYASIVAEGPGPALFRVRAARHDTPVDAGFLAGPVPAPLTPPPQ